MIGRTELVERAAAWGLRPEVVEKDYVIGWLLWGVGRDPVLARTWAFKGGTCLKKCFIETYRFSEDLDFTVLPGGPSAPEAILARFALLLDRVGAESGVDLTSRPPRFEWRPDRRSLKGRVYYRGPRGAPQPARVLVDVTVAEQVVRPTVLRPVRHDYSDGLPTPGTVRCYSFEEVFAEKIRAMGERCRPRDLYDIVNLFRRDDLRGEPEIVRTVLHEKCASKGVPVPDARSFDDQDRRAELAAPTPGVAVPGQLLERAGRPLRLAGRPPLGAAATGARGHRRTLDAAAPAGGRRDPVSVRPRSVRRDEPTLRGDPVRRPLAHDRALLSEAESGGRRFAVLTRGRRRPHQGVPGRPDPAGACEPGGVRPAVASRAHD